MTRNAVTVRSRWTADEFVQAQRYHLRLQVRPLLRWSVMILAAAFDSESDVETLRQMAREKVGTIGQIT